MANKTYKLGELIEEVDIRNRDGKYTEEDVVGVSTDKKMIKTKANLNGVSLLPYKLFPPKTFAYVADTSRRGDKIALAYNNSDKTYIVSTWYVLFKINENAKNIILSDYLFLFFNRSEFDRYSRVNSWGSAREYFWLNDIGDVEITLPDVKTQEKYVEIYESLVENQKSYEQGLDDLKLTCDAYIEELRRKMPCEKIGKYISECNIRNEALKVLDVKGVESSGNFVETKANTDGLDFSNYKIVDVNQFGYNPSRINLGSIALKTDTKCIVSPMYIVFKVDDLTKLIPEYLMLWLSRSEFRRSTQFFTSGSVRDTFDFSEMKEVQIPIPDIKTQQSIADVFNVYNERIKINEKLKSQIKDICPVLIKGSLEA